MQPDSWPVFGVCSTLLLQSNLTNLAFIARSIPMALASCAVLGAAIGTFDYGGKSMTGSSTETPEERRKRFFKHPQPSPFGVASQD